MLGITFELRTDKKGDELGRFPIHVRIKVGKKRFRFATKVRARKEEWDQRTQQIKGDKLRNALLLTIQQRLEKVISLSLLNDEEITREKLLDAIRIDILEQERVRFYDFIKQQIELRKGMYSKQTVKTYYKYINVLKQFAPALTFDQLTVDFVRRYISWMRNRGYAQNTIAFHLKNLRTFCNWAIDSGLIDENPFKEIKVKQVVSERIYLTIEEVKRIEEAYKKNRYNRILQWTLFMIYTGMRYSDISNLKWKNIKDGKIIIRQHKTGEIVSIPITEKIKSVLPERCRPNEYVFKMPCNQVANRQLRRELRKIGIKKHVTLHCLRHTFAITSIQLGIPIEVVSKLLGHTELKTTQIYARIVDKTKEQYMKAWDNL